MDKLLIICGPTAVGKTALALHLGKVFNGELLSADSRQVYRGMDIITGKDMPVNSKFKSQSSKFGYWETPDKIKIWLTDLAEPKEEFSVSQWRKAAMRVLARLRQKASARQGNVRERGKLPIVVGGTGFYIKALLGGIETIDVPQNKKLRSMLSSKTPDELFEILSQLDGVRSANMNQSDRRNPRRLVRAIEVASQNQKSKIKNQKLENDVSVLVIGLKAPREVLRKRIEGRVGKMMKEGALEEVKRLVESGVAWNAQSMTGIGYQKFRDYSEGKISLEEVGKKWVQGDLQYAKRQMTWFKRDKHIQWFDITKPGWQEKLEKKVLDWYNSGSTNAHD